MATRAALPQDVAFPSGFRVQANARPDRQPVPRPPGRTASTRRCRARSRRIRGTGRLLGPPAVRVPGRPSVPVRGQPALQALAADHRRAGLLRRVCAGPSTAALLSPARGLLAPSARAARGRLATRVRHLDRARTGRGARAAPDGPALDGLRRRVASGVRAVGLRRRQSRCRARASAFPARSEDTVRTRVHAPRFGHRGTRARRRPGRVPGRERPNSRFTSPIARRPASARATCRTATSSRSTRARRCCTTSTSSTAATCRDARS